MGLPVVGGLLAACLVAGLTWWMWRQPAPVVPQGVMSATGDVAEGAPGVPPAPGSAARQPAPPPAGDGATGVTPAPGSAARQPAPAAHDDAPSGGPAGAPAPQFDATTDAAGLPLLDLTPTAKEDPEVEAMLTRAAGVARRGDLAGAIAIYRRAIDRNDRSDQAHAALGAVYLEAMQRDAAIKQLQRALELNGNNARALLSLGHAMRAAGDHDRARELYQRYLQVEPQGRAAADVRRLLTTLR